MHTAHWSVHQKPAGKLQCNTQVVNTLYLYHIMYIIISFFFSLEIVALEELGKLQMV